MKRGEPPQSLFFWILFFCSLHFMHAQDTVFKGKVVDELTNEPIVNAKVSIAGTLVYSETNSLGEFLFQTNSLPLGEQIAVISKSGYFSKRYPVIINEGEQLDLQTIYLEYDINEEQLRISTISLSDNELEEGEDDSSFVISGLLQASRDIFLKAAAFDFSSTFFRPRGLGSTKGKILINGIEMNKLTTGRPQWSNWGGLNDAQRNQEFSMGISASEYTFGDLAGTTNIIMRASQYREGGRVSYATSNRTYTGRVMASYNSGLNLDGWAYSILVSRRYGNEGFIDGTLYDANSIFAAVEKRINKTHSINLTSFYTPNRRGRSTAITKEVHDLKGNRYNPNWGYYSNEKKSARIRKVEEPVFMLSHHWNLNTNADLTTTIGMQTGRTTNSRIDTNGTDVLLINGQETYIGGGRSLNANPIHPSNLPSFYLQDTTPATLDYQNAFLAQQQFVNDGQLNWNQLIEANQLQQQQGNNATYILYDDVNEDTQISVNSIFKGQIADHVRFHTAFNFRNLQSINYAEVTDLLGGSSFLDIDAFALSDTGFTQNELANRAQSDLQNRNRTVGVGDRFDYNYEIDATVVDGFAQAQFQYNRVDFFLSGSVSNTSYQRNGLFENGYFPGNQSLGKSKAIDFTNFGIKGGATLKLNGRHAIDVQGAYFTKAPTLQHTFANIRKNNDYIPNVSAEEIVSADASYLIRSPKIKGRLTGYYTDISNTSEVGFFFTETIALDESEETVTFAQENLTGIDKHYFGMELGVEYQITPTFKLKGAAALGQFTYNNNPTLSLSTDNGNISLGAVALKNYKLANGPHNVAQLGFEYRDPDFWWVGATTNYFSNAYVDISAFKRSNNFTIDPDNRLPFNDYDPEIATSLLQQEQLEDYFLVNLVGGKSWRVKGYYVGFFAAVSNMFNQEYRTGGFEQARRANYRTALEEANRDTPIFGNRYFYGIGASYYLSAYVKF